ncbi:MAG: hypothetical protein QM278_03195 [Pseudomonadota bacterium]|nr:hypothetical protein [Pseudomonadota bacterium]
MHSYIDEFLSFKNKAPLLLVLARRLQSNRFKKTQIMGVEEKNQSRQDSGSEKDSGHHRFDRQIVHDFFLSLDSGGNVETLTGQEDKSVIDEVKEANGESSPCLDHPAIKK